MRGPTASLSLGYLVPEFPGQTHVMFWREIEDLRRRGVQLELVSTREPCGTLSVHPWSVSAAKETTYLLPTTVRGWSRAIGSLLRLAPRSHRQIWKALTDSERRGTGRLAVLAAVVLGAELAAVSRSRRWDHLHVHSCAMSADIARFARIMGGAPYSLTLHGPLGDYGPDQKQKWAAASFGLVITDQLRQELLGAIGPDTPGQLVVSSMGTDVDRFSRPECYLAWDGRSPARLFSCGRLNVAKGHSDLIRAVALLHERSIPVVCTIAGEDEQGGAGYRKNLERQITDLRLNDCVTLLGAVSEEEVIEHLRQAHVFVLASRAEPLGVAIMEAMSAGVPVVATRAGGVPGLIDDGRDGLLVAPGSSEELAQALDRVLHDPTLARSLAEHAEATARKRAAGPSSAELLVRLAEGHRV